MGEMYNFTKVEGHSVPVILAGLFRPRFLPLMSKKRVDHILEDKMTQSKLNEDKMDQLDDNKTTFFKNNGLSVPWTKCTILFRWRVIQSQGILSGLFRPRFLALMFQNQTVREKRLKYCIIER